MKLVVLSLFLQIIFAFDINRAGSFYFSPLDHSSGFKNLRIYGDALYKGNSVSVFDYDVRGTLSLEKTALYMSLGRDGKLVLDSQPHIGFQITTQENSSSRGLLSYLGDSVFQLCEDESIRFKSKCWGAQLGTITFEDRFQ